MKDIQISETVFRISNVKSGQKDIGFFSRKRNDNER